MNGISSGIKANYLLFVQSKGIWVVVESYCAGFSVRSQYAKIIGRVANIAVLDRAFCTWSECILARGCFLVIWRTLETNFNRPRFMSARCSVPDLKPQFGRKPGEWRERHFDIRSDLQTARAEWRDEKFKSK
jgi:hypothetical protein